MRNMKFLTYLLLLVLFCSISFIYGGNSKKKTLPSLDINKKIHQYVHDKWTMGDGLPSNSIWSITQTIDGYIWLGTYHGLVRFDGVKFETFNRSNTPQFKNNTILTITADPSGGLWGITSDNFLIQYSDGKFIKHLIHGNQSNGIIRSIYIDQSGKIWIGCSNGLFQYKDNNLQKINLKDLKRGVISIIGDDSGTIWFATTGSGLFKFKNNSFIHFTEDEGLASNNLLKICLDKNLGIYLITAENNLYHYDNFHSTFVKKLVGRSILYPDRSGSLWFGDDALKRLNKNKIEAYSETDGLSDNRVRSIFEDKEGSIWVGSYAGGLDRFKNGRIKVFSKKDGLKENSIWSVYEDKNSILWVGSGTGNIHRMTGGIVTDIIEINDEWNHASKTRKENPIYSIIKDSSGKLWVGSNGGLFSYINDKLVFHKILSGIQIMSIHEPLTKPGTLLIGTVDQGLYTFQDDKIKKWHSFMRNKKWGVNCIYEFTSKPGIIWIGTDRGLVQVKDKEIKIFNTSHGLSHNDVNDLYQSDDGTLWIATSGGGLNLLKNGKIKTFNTNDGLYDDLIWSVVEDKQARLWMSCDRGLFYIKKKDLLDYQAGKSKKIESIVFGISDGLKSTEFNGSSNPVVKCKNGELVYPTMQGIAIINPDNEDVNTLPPQVYIKNITVNGQNINKISGVNMKAGSKNIEFHYTALSFLNPDKMTFKYKLEGYDKDWIDAGIRRTAYYSNIPAQKYTFKVIASNNSGIWNNIGAEYSFSRSAWFYETWWFKSLAVSFLIFMVYLLFHWKLNAEKSRNRKLQAEVYERKKAQEALKQSEQRLQAIFDNTTSVMYLKDIKGRYIMVNRRYEDIFNVSREEIVNKSIYDIFPNETAKAIEANDKEILKSNKLQEFENQIMHKDGLHTYITVKFPLYDTDNKTYALCGISTDITNRKLAEEELNQLRNYLSSIIDSMPSVLVGMNINGRVTLWNKTAEQTTGVAACDAEGKILSDVFPRMGSEMGKITESIRTREIKKEIKKPYQKENRTIYENVTIYPLVSNGVDGAVIRIDDVSKEYEMEEQLNHRSKMDAIGQLAGGVAHDFNNMLAGIMGAAQLLKLPKKGLNNESLVFVDLILQAVERAADLTSRLLAFGRKDKIPSTAQDVHDIIDDTISILKSTIDKKIKLTVKKDAENFIIVGDNSELQNVFMNIAINASHAMPNGGKLQIETKNIQLDKTYCDASPFVIFPGEYIKIELRDTGSGIPLENLRKIFEPFFTTKEQGKGTGLGLATVYKTVQHHQGVIDVYSEVGEGTAFHILLPCSEESAGPRLVDAEVSKGSGQILLVDDEEIIRITGSYMLEEMGYEVLLAENGREAVEIFKDKSKVIDLVIMDMIMPEMNGSEAFLKMKDIDKDCKVIISSGFTKNESLIELRKRGLAGFINKPFRDFELGKILAKLLNSKN